MNISLISTLLRHEASFRQVKRHTLRDQTQAIPCSLAGTVVGVRRVYGHQNLLKSPKSQECFLVSFIYQGTPTAIPQSGSADSLCMNQVAVYLRWTQPIVTSHTLI